MCHFFIGKLDATATEQDLKEYLTDKGIDAQHILKLKALQKWQEKSAAFKVSVLETQKNDFMSADLWPDKVEVREWFFKPRS